jgi:hypothetical protein
MRLRVVCESVTTGGETLPLVVKALGALALRTDNRHICVPLTMLWYHMGHKGD